MKFDYARLKGKIIELYGNQYNFADAYGITRQALSNKMTSRTCWSQKEILKVCEMLGIDKEEIPFYFFKVVNKCKER